MNARENKTDKNKRDARKRAFPFVVEFVKFSTGFVVLIALALLTLRFVNGTP